MGRKREKLIPPTPFPCLLPLKKGFTFCKHDTKEQRFSGFGTDATKTSVFTRPSRGVANSAAFCRGVAASTTSPESGTLSSASPTAASDTPADQSGPDSGTATAARPGYGESPHYQKLRKAPALVICVALPREPRVLVLLDSFFVFSQWFEILRNKNCKGNPLWGFR